MNVLILAAHPDDEILGCGGTIAKHAQRGDTVHVAIFAEGLTSRNNQRDRAAHNNELAKLAAAAHRANEILGVLSLTLLDFPDNRMDSLDMLAVVKKAEEFIDKFQPEIIYTHHPADINIDHKIVHDVVITACRPTPLQIVKRFLFFEVPSSTEWQVSGVQPLFAPNWFVDVTETLSLKLKALEAYKSEMRDWPHPRSLKAVEHLACWRGSSVGVEAAEAFVLGRNIVK